MLNIIGTWVFRKFIWFVLILAGIIAFPYVSELEHMAQQTIAEVDNFNEGKAALKNFVDKLDADSQGRIDRAQHETDTKLQALIEEETKEITRLNEAIKPITVFDLAGKPIKDSAISILNNAELEAQLKYASWIKAGCEQIKTARDRLRSIQVQEAEINNKIAIYNQKKQVYDSATGIDSGSQAASKLISGVNKLTSWSGYEIKDNHKAFQDLDDLRAEIESDRKKLDDLRRAHDLPSNIQKPTSAEIMAKLQHVESQLKDHWLFTRIINPAKQNWPYALLLLLVGTMLSPISRVICFYLLAPVADRQAPIRWNAVSNTDEGIKESMASSTGISLKLNPGDILLSHHDYAKAIPKHCKADTQLVLAPTLYITSLLSGLFNLVRIEPTESATVEISSGHDGLNELICIELAEGTGLIIEPRSVVGVVIKKGGDVILSKRWALGKLQSWFKGQLRYISIAGPLTIILKGNRGVTVTPVHDELMIDPEHVVAFSSNLGYGTARTETFGGYYSRKKSLLKDRFIGNHGFVIHQEAGLDSNMSSKKSGLEGVVDGVLKAFGI